MRNIVAPRTPSLAAPGVRIAAAGCLVLAACSSSSTPRLAAAPPPPGPRPAATPPAPPAPAPDPAPPALRLPGDVRPAKYALELTLVPDRERATGRVAIDAQVVRPARVVWLN